MSIWQVQAFPPRLCLKWMSAWKVLSFPPRVCLSAWWGCLSEGAIFSSQGLPGENVCLKSLVPPYQDLPAEDVCLKGPVLSSQGLLGEDVCLKSLGLRGFPKYRCLSEESSPYLPGCFPRVPGKGTSILSHLLPPFKARKHFLCYGLRMDPRCPRSHWRTDGPALHVMTSCDSYDFWPDHWRHKAVRDPSHKRGILQGQGVR